MIDNFIPSRTGERILLYCIDCKTAFYGSNSGNGLSRILLKTRCLRCKSKKVVQHPGIQY